MAEMAAKAMLQDATLHFLQPQGEMVSEHLALMVEALMAVAAHKAAEEDIMAGVEAEQPQTAILVGVGVADLQFL